MRFEVRALSAANQLQTVLLDAEDEQSARRAAEAQKLRPVTVRRVQAKGGARGRSKAFSLVLFSQELLALLEAGLTLVEGIEALVEKESSPVARSIMESLLGRMREGLRFSDAIALQPEYFPPLYIGIVKAAERTSDLPRALTRFIDYQIRLDAVRSKIVGAMIYPSILFSVGGLVGLFLMGFVVPKFAEVYKDSGRDLPWASQLLLSWGNFLSEHLAIVLGMVALLIAGMVVGMQKMNREGRWGQLFSKLPGIAERVRIIELSRLYLTMGMLLEGGIPIVPTLEMVSGTVSANTRKSLALARADISHGDPVSKSFEANGLVTPIALRMLRVGERSGQLGTMLMRSALFYEGESTRWIDRFSKTFEPALMALIGLVVGLIVVLLYMPIFDLAGSLQ
ncbi:type II secretion system F family protein [Uliginosibacterium sp. H1]|uniref:type II secretion system F family protein n=1 Tax=Uliginosibacterium sp. H1 TaxID=3114757 RepID=UPI002E171A4F|nr:type II secretion system F family protein [Uliginosibacterium sp. H1]